MTVAAIQRDFVVVRVSKRRWRVAVVRFIGDELQAIDFVSGKHKTRARAKEACKSWRDSTYGTQYGEY